MKKKSKSNRENGCENSPDPDSVEDSKGDIRSLGPTGYLIGAGLLTIGIVHFISGQVSARSLQLAGVSARIFAGCEMVCGLTFVWGVYRAFRER